MEGLYSFLDGQDCEKHLRPLPKTLSDDMGLFFSEKDEYLVLEADALVHEAVQFTRHPQQISAACELTSC